MINMTAIAEVIQPYLQANNISWVYLSTDSCEVVSELRTVDRLGFGSNVIVSPCDREASPTRGRPQDTLRLLAEIEMMRHGNPELEFQLIT